MVCGMHYERLGFGERLIELVLNCVKSVSYALLVNRVQIDVFKPSRVLR